MRPISASASRFQPTPALNRAPPRRRVLVVAVLCAMTAVSLVASNAGGAEVRTGRCDTAAHRFALGHRVSHLRTLLKTRDVWILHTATGSGDEFSAC